MQALTPSRRARLTNFSWESLRRRALSTSRGALQEASFVGRKGVPLVHDLDGISISKSGELVSSDYFYMTSTRVTRKSLKLHRRHERNSEQDLLVLPRGGNSLEAPTQSQSMQTSIEMIPDLVWAVLAVQPIVPHGENLKPNLLRNIGSQLVVLQRHNPNETIVRSSLPRNMFWTEDKWKANSRKTEL